MTATLTRLAFTVDPKPFAAAVAWAAKNLPARPTMPVLGGMLLTVVDGRLTVTAFDEETAGTATLDVDNASDGTVLVFGRTLHGLTSTLKGRKPLQVAHDGAQVTVNYGGILTLPTLPVEDYPSIPDMPATIGTVDGEAFARIVGRVALAAATDATVPVLTTASVRLAVDSLTMLASDRYRGAMDRIPLDGYTGPDTEILVPAVVLKAAAPLLAETGGPVTLSASDSLFGMATPSRSLTTRLLAGEFPKIDRLIPPRADKPILLPVAGVVEAVKRANLTRSKAGPVLLTFTDGQVSVGATGDDGQLHEPIDLDYEGHSQTLATNPDYLADALHAAGGQNVELSLNANPRGPFVVTAVDDGVYRHFCMPIRTH